VFTLLASIHFSTPLAAIRPLAASQELMPMVLTSWATLLRYLMASMMSGAMDCSAVMKNSPRAFWPMLRSMATNWSTLMKEKAPAKASMPPQPPRSEGAAAESSW
jgi:hypothetical protein